MTFFSQFLRTQYINHDLQVTLQRIQVTNEHTKSKIKQLTESNIKASYNARVNRPKIYRPTTQL